MLVEIETGNYIVKAIGRLKGDGGYEIPVLDFLKEQSRTSGADVRKMRTLLKRYAEGGLRKLSGEVFHKADKDNAWRFSSGQLRLYGFIDGNIIILTHGTLKKTQKTDVRDKETIKKERENYFKERQ